MNIFIAKLSGDTTSNDLKELFSEYGEVSTANVILDRYTRESKRFGFVEMNDDEAAKKAIAELDGCEYDHSTIVVKEAEPRENRRSSNRGGFNRGGGQGSYNRDGGNRGGGYDRNRGRRDRY
ncbi:MAG: RNA-binding protein [Flavobacteriia bacterium]|nr:MAG: RNA-binding protein [Flavobacteriia bacterium]